MGRPSSGYEIDGEKVPGVTTILSRFKESGGLMYWAWQQGKDGKDFRDTSQKAADAGTCVHAMIEEDWHGTTFDRTKYPPEILEKADHAYKGYLRWKEQTQLRIIKPELTLVSKQYRFGGTLDALMVSGHLSMGDWKSSNGIYPDMLLQVAGGYAILWDEHFPDQPLQGMELVRFSKPEHRDDPVSFHHHSYSAEIFPICKKQFLLLREAYENDKRIKKLI